MRRAPASSAISSVRTAARLQSCSSSWWTRTMAADAAAVVETDEAPRHDVDGATAAAILLMLLAEEDAGEIVKALDPAEVRRLGESMFKVANADERTIEAALDLFVERCRGVSALAVGAEPRIR